MPKPVLTKADFVQRYYLGEFGNRAPTWNTLEEYMDSNYAGLVHVRNRTAGAATWYNVKAVDLVRVWYEAADQYGARGLYISAMAPHDKTILQGEVQQIAPFYMVLNYTVHKAPMREAFKRSRIHCVNLEALSILKSNLCSNSYVWMQHLLEVYPQHVVEFSTFSTNWGTIPRCNTVFWEVRRY